jgi:predicted nucleic acid-binding protein
MFVIDASALGEVFVGSDERAERLRWRVARVPLVAPHLIDIEMLSLLRGRARGKKITEAAAEGAVALLPQFPVTRYDHPPLAQRIWELRHNAGAYDAAYLALAEHLSIPLLTTDKKMTGVSGAACQVELVI